jgi:4'-phosphopantetheinyl transferase
VNPQIALQEKTRDIRALSEGEVHVWEITLDDPALKTGDLFGEVLSGDEKTRATRLIPGVYRDRFVTARGYMRIILGFYLDMPPGGIRFEYNKHGKPALPAEANPKSLRFNLSHSRSLALCAVTVRGEIGIDVEYPRRVLRAEKILERFFSEAEREYYRSRRETEKERAFMGLWTIKEAYSKALGKGLSSQLRNVDLSPALSGEATSRASVRRDNRPEEIWTIHRFSPGDEYVAALALKGEPSAISRYLAGPGFP